MCLIEFRAVETINDARIAARTRAAVHEALRALFAEEGPAALTHQRVAQRAEVGRATIYRHWPRPVDLVTEALSVVDQPVFRSREGSLRAWLGGELARFAADLAQPAATQFVATVIGTADQVQAVADLRDDLLRRISAVLGSGLAQADATGEPGRRLDPDELLARLLGPVIFRVAIQQLAADRDFIDRLVDGALGTAEGTGHGHPMTSD
jgi:AcrR family transcriptional regulator